MEFLTDCVVKDVGSVGILFEKRAELFDEGLDEEADGGGCG